MKTRESPALLQAFYTDRLLLEHERGHSARTRNARLAALHAFFRYVALTEPTHALQCQQVLATPSKHFERGVGEFPTADEVNALIEAPDSSTWIGRRDRTLLLLVAVQTGLRVSEFTALRHEDVALGRGAHVRCRGKGRKLRCTPLRPDVVKVLKAWLNENAAGPDHPVFPSSRCGCLSANVERLVAKHVATAQRHCPSLERRRITPHTLRHTAAVMLPHAGVDRSVIALWLGHESIETTQIYLQADLRLKEKALARTNSTDINAG